MDQRYVSSIGILKKLCEFSIVWADQAGLGSQKSFSKLTSILPRKTQDNFQIDTQKFPKLENKTRDCFQTKKVMLVLDNY